MLVLVHEAQCTLNFKVKNIKSHANNHSICLFCMSMLIPWRDQDYFMQECYFTFRFFRKYSLRAFDNFHANSPFNAIKFTCRKIKQHKAFSMLEKNYYHCASTINCIKECSLAIILYSIVSFSLHLFMALLLVRLISLYKSFS